MRARVKLVKKRDGEIESKWSSQINYQNVVFLLLFAQDFRLLFLQMVFAYKKKEFRNEQQILFLYNDCLRGETGHD